MYKTGHNICFGLENFTGSKIKETVKIIKQGSAKR
jgi:hypothetical protein